MNRLQLSNKLDTLIPNTIEGLKGDCLKLAESGGIDIESYDDGYILPKVLLAVVLERKAEQIAPFKSMKKEWRDLRNLRHF